MKIAIPIANGKLCMHFGHCETFAVIDTDNDGNIVNSQSLVPPPHEPGVLPKWLGEIGANVIIAGGMGHRAQDLFTQAGVKVVTGAPALDPETLVKQYLSQNLVTGPNTCDH